MRILPPEIFDRLPGEAMTCPGEQLGLDRTAGDGVERSEHSLIGDCPGMQDVYDAIRQVAGHDVNVLIRGETGTGKELVARAIYDRSARADRPFLAMNCAAIPETLLESELFGHERGAFSGADRRRVGKFEQSDGGMILLDEIGDMPLSFQAKILRLLQDQTFERVGGNTTLRTNVRLIASTHRDLKSMAASGRFRQDLYYRLNGFTIDLPPLRERGDDVRTLARHFLRLHARRFGRAVDSISNDAMDRLREHAWPGNVRELHGAIQQGLLRATGTVVTTRHLPEWSTEVGPTEANAALDGFDIAGFLQRRLSWAACNLYEDLHRELDRLSLCRVLNFTGGNQQSAARLLGIARQTLRAKMREAGVQVASSAETIGLHACGDRHETEN